MTLPVGSAVEGFSTKDTIHNGTTGAISNGAMSVLGDVLAWTNTENAPLGKAVLVFQYPSGTITGDISLHVRPINIDGALDAPQPTTASKTGFAGTFGVAKTMPALTDVAHYCYVPFSAFSTKSAQEYEFYLFDATGAQITPGWRLYMTGSGLVAAV